MSYFCGLTYCHLRLPLAMDSSGYHANCVLQMTLFHIVSSPNPPQVFLSFLPPLAIQPIYTTSLCVNTATLQICRNVNATTLCSFHTHACPLHFLLEQGWMVYKSQSKTFLFCPWLNRVLKTPFYDNCAKSSSISQAPAQYFTWHLSPSFSPSSAIRRSRPRKRRQSTRSWLS